MGVRRHSAALRPNVRFYDVIERPNGYFYDIVKKYNREVKNVYSTITQLSWNFLVQVGGRDDASSEMGNVTSTE